ncbi:hypothetical protein [Pseudomonas laurentiana]|uniref:hypothetical protein n=1 Tax=Pseudomonas laurentiana TaxID=2364649 RepID=UPI00167ABBA9|nr:hypothetical protein [Pseudomonas laurentiana]
MPTSCPAIAYAAAHDAVVVVRGVQQPAMISHYPPPVSGVPGCLVAPPGVVVVVG